MTKIVLRAHNRIGSCHYHPNCSCHIQKKESILSILFCSFRRTSTTLRIFIIRLTGSVEAASAGDSLRKCTQLLEQVPLFVNERLIVITLQLIPDKQSTNTELVLSMSCCCVSQLLCSCGWLFLFRHWVIFLIIYTLIEWTQEVLNMNFYGVLDFKIP